MQKAVTIHLEGDGTLRGQADGREGVVLTGCPPVGRCDGRDLLIVFEKSVLWKPASSLNQSSVGFTSYWNPSFFYLKRNVNLISI